MREAWESRALRKTNPIEAEGASAATMLANTRCKDRTTGSEPVEGMGSEASESARCASTLIVEGDGMVV